MCLGNKAEPEPGEQREASVHNTPPPANEAANPDAAPEMADVEDDATKFSPSSAALLSQTEVATAAAAPAPPAEHVHESGSPPPPIDVCFEASKLPLDVAIFNSTRAAGGDEKIRKYLQAVLVIGGTALIPGMPHALESRSVAHSISAFDT
jgi:actin-related protein 8